MPVSRFGTKVFIWLLHKDLLASLQFLALAQRPSVYGFGTHIFIIVVCFRHLHNNFYDFLFPDFAHRYIWLSSDFFFGTKINMIVFWFRLRYKGFLFSVLAQRSLRVSPVFSFGTKVFCFRLWHKDLFECLLFLALANRSL